MRIFFFFSALGLTCAAPLSAQFSGHDDPNSALLSYIHSQTADPSCGVCLGAAQKFFADQKQNNLLKKTKGMALIAAGKYYLGSPEGSGDPDEHPAVEIFLDAFYIDKTDVTLTDFMKFAKGTNANFPEWAAPGGKFNMETGKDDYYRRLQTLTQTCGNCPAFGVSWASANAYCQWKKKRLPTEAEWEAAARAGSKELYSFGDLPTVAGAYAWTEDNSSGVPHPVAQKKPNKNGLYDMHGNVWNWMADLYDKTYYASRPNKNPPGPATGKDHVIRGGSWSQDIDSTRSGNRASAKDANDDIGFRCVASEADLLQQHDNGF